MCLWLLAVLGACLVNIRDSSEKKGESTCQECCCVEGEGRGGVILVRMPKVHAGICSYCAVGGIRGTTLIVIRITTAINSTFLVYSWH